MAGEELGQPRNYNQDGVEKARASKAGAPGREGVAGGAEDDVVYSGAGITGEMPMKVAEAKNEITRIMRWGKASDLEALLSREPKLEKTALWQKKAVKLACQQGKPDCIRFLLEHSGKLEEKFNKYIPIWVYALKYDSVEMLKIMEEHRVLNFDRNNFRWAFYYSIQNKATMAYLWDHYGATLGLGQEVWRGPIYGRNLVTMWLRTAVTLFEEAEAQMVKRVLQEKFGEVGVVGPGMPREPQSRWPKEGAFEAGVRMLWEREIQSRNHKVIKTMLEYGWQVQGRDGSLVYALQVPSLDCAEVLLTDAKIVRDTKEMFREQKSNIFGRLKPSLRMLKVIGEIGLDPVDAGEYSWLHQKSEQLALTTLRAMKKQHPEWLEVANDQSKDTVWERVPVDKRVVLNKEELQKALPEQQAEQEPGERQAKHRL